jgi:hypothetical protein
MMPSLKMLDLMLEFPVEVTSLELPIKPPLIVVEELMVTLVLVPETDGASDV